MRLLKQNIYYLKNFCCQLLSVFLLFLIKFYRYVISPVFPSSCRYAPTCSEYALTAIQMHGPFKGSYLAGKRLLSCHPWSASGYDPVPEKNNNYSCKHQQHGVNKGI